MVRAANYIVLFIISGSLSCKGALAVNSDNRGLIHYNLNIHTGSALPHHLSMTYLNREYIKSVEFNAWFDNTTISNSHKTILGAGYFFSNLGNRAVYGNFHAPYFGMINPLFTNKWPVKLKIGVGIACATKKYDIETNYFNRAIGSHLNAYGQVTLTGDIPLKNDKWVIRPGISFHHLSNGKIVSPNQGINLLTISAGIDFRSGHEHSGSFVLKKDATAKGKNRFSVIFAPGVKQVDRRVDKQILTSSLLFEYGYMYRPERSIGLGIGFFYNDTWAYIPYIRTEKDDSLPPFQSALHISVQRNKGPLAFFLHPGIYIYMPAKDKPYMTNRIGMKYSFENNITLQFSIKSHWFAIADYFEWGIGYEFNR
ncbi:MAG: acyloxyacyl hydrolase [Bacteroidales bacterium]